MNPSIRVDVAPSSLTSMRREIRFGDQFVVNLFERQAGYDTWQLPPRRTGATLIVVQYGELEGHHAEQTFQCHPKQALWITGAVEEGALTLTAMSSLRCVMLHMSDAFLHAYQPSAVGGCTVSTFQVLRCAAYRALQPLIRQMFACPWHDGCGDLFLSGKAMEMAALAIHHLSEVGLQDIALSAAASDAEQLQRARAILMREYRKPPGLNELAARVGANTRKLTRGFRRRYGKSVYAWLQEFRLQLAYSLLCSTDVSVSGVAADVGYTTAHFCSIFRQRFGVSPGKLTHG